MTKIFNFALKIKGGGRGGWHMRSPPTLPPPQNLKRALNVRQLIKLDAVSVIYRTENGLVPDTVKTWFTKCSSVHSYNTRAAAEGNFVILKMRTEKGKQAFIVSGAKLWNEIPDSVKKFQVN